MTARVKYNGVEKYQNLVEHVGDFVRELESELPPDSKIDLSLSLESKRTDTYRVRARIRGLRQEIFAQVKGSNIVMLLHKIAAVIFDQAARLKDRAISRRRNRKSPRHEDAMRLQTFPESPTLQLLSSEAEPTN